MSNPLEQEVLDAMASAAGVDGVEIDMDTNLYDLGIDSLSSLEILVALEKRFGVRVPEESLQNTSSVREIVNAFVEGLERGCSSASATALREKGG